MVNNEGSQEGSETSGAVALGLPALRKALVVLALRKTPDAWGACHGAPAPVRRLLVRRGLCLLDEIVLEMTTETSAVSQLLEHTHMQEIDGLLARDRWPPMVEHTHTVVDRLSVLAPKKTPDPPVPQLLDRIRTWPCNEFLYVVVAFLDLPTRVRLGGSCREWADVLNCQHLVPTRCTVLHRSVFTSRTSLKDQDPENYGDALFNAEIFVPFLTDHELYQVQCLDVDIHNMLFCVCTTMISVYAFDRLVPPEHPQSPVTAHL